MNRYIVKMDADETQHTCIFEDNIGYRYFDENYNGTYDIGDSFNPQNFSLIGIFYTTTQTIQKDKNYVYSSPIR